MKSLKFCVLLLIISDIKVCWGGYKLIPVHQIVIHGGTAIFNCWSDVTNYQINWLYSHQNDYQTADVVYSGEVKYPYQDKMRVSQSRNESIIQSELIIENVEMKDAGVLYCSDEDGTAAPAAAHLSIADEIRCSAMCVNDRLLLSCSTCYHTQEIKKLNHYLKYNGLNVSANLSSEAFDAKRHCTQMESIWSLSTSCKRFCNKNETLNIELRDNVTTATMHKSATVTVLDTCVKVETTTQTETERIVQEGRETCDSTVNIVIGSILAVFVFVAVLVSVLPPTRRRLIRCFLKANGYPPKEDSEGLSERHKRLYQI